MLDQPYMTDLIEANSMGHEPHLIDIYSASWGPTDDGKTVDGPRNATMRAIVRGVNEGRRGLGNIYVWASGDGGSDDDCNCDGYAASMWTISINSAINDGQNAHYDESCSSTLASTFSNGAKDPNTGVLTWRDMQHLTVLTSKRNSLFDAKQRFHWTMNGVGLEFNHLFGFGVLDAGGMVSLAKLWKTVPPRFHCQAGSIVEPRSMILSRRPKDDDSRDGFTKWPFMTTHTWGEDPKGRWTLELLVLILLQAYLTYVSCETFTEEVQASPGVAMEYKVHVDPGKEECYYQHVQQGATIYVSFQVLRGGDGMAGFAVRHPSGQLIHPYQWKASSEYQEVSATGGYYGICVDNQFSRFAAKLVNLYITTFRYDQWEKFAQELQEADVSAENCTRILQGVDMRIQEMLQHQQLSRSREARDYSLLIDNNSYVQFWSFIQIVVVVTCFVVQVYFVKKLFDTKSGVRGRI
nr:EOG090X0AV2 [Eulimnadia texana]